MHDAAVVEVEALQGGCVAGEPVQLPCVREHVVAEGERLEAREVHAAEVELGHVAEVLVAVECEAGEVGGAGLEPGFDELVHEVVESFAARCQSGSSGGRVQCLLWKCKIFFKTWVVMFGDDE